MDERVAATTQEERFRALLSSVFGLVALVRGCWILCPHRTAGE